MTFLLTKTIYFYFLAIYSYFYSCKVLVVLFLQNSFILVLGKANVKCAQSCIDGRQNLREYLFCLQLLVGFDTLIYRRRLQTIPYACGLLVCLMFICNVVIWWAFCGVILRYPLINTYLCGIFFAPVVACTIFVLQYHAVALFSR